MRVVVTGGAGFIGANVVAARLERPGTAEVRVVDEFSGGDEADLAGCDAAPRSVAAPRASHEVNTPARSRSWRRPGGPAVSISRRPPRPRSTGPTASCPRARSCEAEPLSPYAAGKPAAALAGRPLTVEWFRTQPAAGAS